MNHGVVSRDFIRKDETSYHSPGSRSSENVVGDPVIEVLEGEYVCTYPMSFFHQTPNGKWARGIADISMRIRMGQHGFAISEQHVKIREEQKSP